MRTVICRLAFIAGILSFVPGASYGEDSVTVNGHRLFYERHGAGRPLVLLHGGGSTPQGSFPDQIDTFALNHEVIAPEQVGHGHTPDIAGAYSYTQMMEDTAALLDRLGVHHADIVGWSDGGILALMLAVHHPGLVRRLVVSGANITPDGLTDEAQAANIAMQAAKRDDDVHRHAFSLLPYTRFHGPGFEEKLGALWLNSPTGDQLSTELLSRVKKHVLLIVGENDLVRREHTLEIFSALRAGQLFVVPNANHGTFSESADQVNPVVLAFLDRP